MKNTLKKISSFVLSGCICAGMHATPTHAAPPKKAVADFDMPLTICGNDLAGASFFRQTHPDSFYFGPDLNYLHCLHKAISDSSSDPKRYKSIVRLFLDYIKKRYEEELAYRLIIRFDAPVNLVNTISMLWAMFIMYTDCPTLKEIKDGTDKEPTFRRHLSPNDTKAFSPFDRLLAASISANGHNPFGDFNREQFQALIDCTIAAETAIFEAKNEDVSYYDAVVTSITKLLLPLFPKELHQPLNDYCRQPLVISNVSSLRIACMKYSSHESLLSVGALPPGSLDKTSCFKLPDYQRSYTIIHTLLRLALNQPLLRTNGDSKKYVLKWRTAYRNLFTCLPVAIPSRDSVHSFTFQPTQLPFPWSCPSAPLDAFLKIGNRATFASLLPSLTGADINLSYLLNMYDSYHRIESSINSYDDFYEFLSKYLSIPRTDQLLTSYKAISPWDAMPLLQTNMSYDPSNTISIPPTTSGKKHKHSMNPKKSGMNQTTSSLNDDDDDDDDTAKTLVKPNTLQLSPALFQPKCELTSHCDANVLENIITCGPTGGVTSDALSDLINSIITTRKNYITITEILNAAGMLLLNAYHTYPDAMSNYSPEKAIYALMRTFEICSLRSHDPSSTDSLADRLLHKLNGDGDDNKKYDERMLPYIYQAIREADNCASKLIEAKKGVTCLNILQHAGIAPYMLRVPADSGISETDFNKHIDECDPKGQNPRFEDLPDIIGQMAATGWILGSPHLNLEGKLATLEDPSSTYLEYHVQSYCPRLDVSNPCRIVVRVDNKDKNPTITEIHFTADHYRHFIRLF